MIKKRYILFKNARHDASLDWPLDVRREVSRLIEILDDYLDYALEEVIIEKISKVKKIYSDYNLNKDSASLFSALELNNIFSEEELEIIRSFMFSTRKSSRDLN